MTDARRTKPGIKPRTLMDVPLRDSYLEGATPNLSALAAAFDDMAKRPVRVKRNGVRLLVRKLCYFVLSRT